MIAEEDYNLGKAYFCVDPASGSVYRVCPEYSTSFELVSSSVEALRACMEAAAQWSSQNPTAQILTDPKKTVDALEKQLSAIDPTALASPKSHWPLLLDHIRHYAPYDDDELEFWFKLS